MPRIQFRNLTPRIRFILVSGLTLLPLAGVMLLVGILVYTPIFNAMESVVQQSVNRLIPLHNLQDSLHRAAMPPNDYLIHERSGERRRFRRLASRVESQFDQVESVFADNPGKLRRLEKIRKEWQRAEEEGKTLMSDDLPPDKAGEAMERFDGRIHDTIERLDSFIESLRGQIKNEFAEAQALQRYGLWILVGAFILAMALGLGGAILMTRDRQNLRETSLRDPLTGLYNRRGLDSRLNEVANPTLTYRQPKFTLMLIDLDLFKGINDTYGHAVGDQALSNLADTIQAHLREEDIFARVGGDEFVAALVDIPPSKAPALGERIREAVAGNPLAKTEDGKGVFTTVTIGFACYPDDSEDVNMVMESADQALYWAKEAGRNAVRGYQASYTS